MQDPTGQDRLITDYRTQGRVRTLSRLLLLSIVMLLSACDNVNWGGAQFSVVAPPPGARSSSQEEDLAEQVIDEQPPTGPILYYVRAGEDQAVLVPVASIEPDTLHHISAQEDWELYSQRFITHNLRQGTEFTLFHHGERAGTFVLHTAQIPGEDLCPRTPRATGTLELNSSAIGTTEFLALAKTHAPTGGRRRAAPSLQPDRRLPLQAGILAERAIRARGARLPNNWERAMIDFRVFPTPGSADPSFAATFTIGDSTGRGANPSGYSIFLIAQPKARTGYEIEFIDFIDFATRGRATPRVIDFLDWNRSGGTGLLLEVTSGADTWFEAVGLHNGSWRPLLQTRCEAPPASAAEREGTDSIPGSRPDTAG